MFHVTGTQYKSFLFVLRPFLVGGTARVGRFLEVFCGSPLSKKRAVAFAAPAAGRAGVAPPVLVVENILSAGLTAAVAVVIRAARPRRGIRLCACAGRPEPDGRRPSQLKGVLLPPRLVGAVGALVVVSVFCVTAA